MRFGTIEYLQFAKRRLDLAPPRVNLASSGMPPPDWADLGLGSAPCAALPLSAPTPYGYEPLRRAIAQRYGCAPEAVLTASGTSLANFLVCAALLSPGDRVALERPCYEPLAATIRALEAEPVWIDRPAASGFEPDEAAFARALARGVRLLVLTDLHNPSAALLDRALRARLIARAAEGGCSVLIDEVYLDGVFDRCADSAAGLGPHVVVTSSLTKTWGLGALRCGWAIGAPALIERAWAVNDHLGVEPPCVTEAIALRAFERLEQLTERARARRAACLPLVRRFASEHGLRWHEPAGGLFVWLGLPAGLRARRVADTLRRVHDVQITPGDFFGVPDHVRLGFGAPPDLVANGLACFGRVLAGCR